MPLSAFPSSSLFHRSLRPILHSTRSPTATAPPLLPSLARVFLLASRGSNYPALRYSIPSPLLQLHHPVCISSWTQWASPPFLPCPHKSTLPRFPIFPT